jgi:hypothetical protein
MLRFFANRALGAFSKRYDYDVSYMRAILASSPRAFMRLAGITKAAQHCEVAPKNAFYSAKLIGALAEDCGPCTQLVVNMAREAGVADAQIEAVLRRETAAMAPDTALGFRFAEAVVFRQEHEDETREAVRAQWGDKGVIDLTYALQIGRLFPMIKAGLGYAKECRRVHIGARPVDVAKRAA